MLNHLAKKFNVEIPRVRYSDLSFFLLYINDLPKSTLFFTSLFADDTGFMKSVNSLETLFSSANTELTYAASWFQANKLTLNVSKTKYMVFFLKNMEFKDKNYKLMI